ncbi:transcription termination factor Rho [Nocardioides sp.]|uniref:transcription termination factor Rho n=1 Tax=Nocardioides sp. TaxID=35761 RepID=UPI00351809C5
MSDTPDSPAAPQRKRAGGLNAMLLADLKAMAAGMGISGAGSLKKADLIEAIKAAQSTQTGQPAAPAAPTSKAAKAGAPATDGGGFAAAESAPAPQVRQRTRSQRSGGAPAAPEASPTDSAADAPAEKASDAAGRKSADKPADNSAGKTAPTSDQREGDAAQDGSGRRQERQRGNQQGNQQANQQGNQQGKTERQQGKNGNQNNQGPKDERPDRQQDKQADKQADKQGQHEPDHDDEDGDGEGGGRRNRRRRGRDRDRTARAGREPDTEVREDDVLVPAAGILDVLDNYAFVRTSGYLAGADDVYLSLSMVRRYGLRRGDAVTGQVRQPRDGERREKFNPMVRIDTVNGVEPDQARNRVDFDTLTPVSPTERLRLENVSGEGAGDTGLVGRVLDLVAPVGKGQRGLILSPAGAGKTTLLKAVAAAVTANSPETHLMVVLLDERPEEVTEYRRAVKGEVIASTFDRPATDHTTMAELAIERAKRLVELGHDVVVLLDGLTGLGRAYNLTAPASGRVLPGGVDAAALYPPKRFFGAARNIENGGSLTILATATVESGSKLDEAILEEFTGTANLHVRLRRELAEHGVFPAVDVLASRTRREDLLLPEQELAVLEQLRRRLLEQAGESGRAPVEVLLDQLRRTQSNVEFLMSARTA